MALYSTLLDLYAHCLQHCRYELLTRTADGNEGGRHQLLTAAVGNGNLYVCKVQIGDKRWFKGELAAILLPHLPAVSLY